MPRNIYILDENCDYIGEGMIEIYNIKGQCVREFKIESTKVDKSVKINSVV